VPAMPVDWGTYDDPPFHQEGAVRDDTYTSVPTEPINDGIGVQEVTPARPPMPKPMTNEAPVMKTASEPQQTSQQPVVLENTQSASPELTKSPPENRARATKPRIPTDVKNTSAKRPMRIRRIWTTPYLYVV
jgi:hypothetical protein